MMIKSMTAYAVVERSDQGFSLCVEIRTYNSRYLDIALRLPPGCGNLEEKVKTMIASRLVRGRVELRLSYKDASESAQAYELDLPKAKAYFSCIEHLKEAVNMRSESITLDHLASIPGIIVSIENNQPLETHWPLISDTLQEALALAEQMRQKEGSFIGQDIEKRLDGIEERLAQVEAATDGMLSLYRDRLQARIETLTQGSPGLDPVRLAQEAAILADRSDISEEIVRARSHIVQFRTIMNDAEPSGRKLNFLLQEFNREFNTMGSKAGQASVAHTIVDIKTEIEKLREQVQNIE